jgi:hypothetical protein
MSIDPNELYSEAYISQIQLLYLAYKNRMRTKELPFLYKETNQGKTRIPQADRWKTFFKTMKFHAPFMEILKFIINMTDEHEVFVAEYEEMLTPPKLKNDGRFEVKENYALSIGVMAYNEENIIEQCIVALQNHKLTKHYIKEIIIVSSGSTDRTNEIVNEYALKDNRIKLIIQPK